MSSSAYETCQSKPTLSVLEQDDDGGVDGDVAAAHGDDLEPGEAELVRPASRKQEHKQTSVGADQDHRRFVLCALDSPLVDSAKQSNVEPR